MIEITDKQFIINELKQFEREDRFERYPSWPCQLGTVLTDAGENIYELVISITKFMNFMARCKISLGPQSWYIKCIEKEIVLRKNDRAEEFKMELVFKAYEPVYYCIETIKRTSGEFDIYE